MRSTEIAARVAELVREHYVFPDVAEKIATHLGAQDYGAQDYPDRLTAAELAERLTADLQSVNGDLHLRVVHRDRPFTDERVDPQTWRREYADEVTRNAGGVSTVELLDGNVGLLKIAPQLYLPMLAGDAVGGALSLLAGTDALLLDLRDCLGGSPAMVAFVCTYFFDEEPVHLNDIVSRDPAATQQFWTLPYVPGRRYGPDKPVYVLIGEQTFSGAEELAYNLQQLGRATLVGAVSRGGANPREAFRLTEHLEARISVARSVNPITGTNWEGTGVHPDIPARSADAHTVAHHHARTHHSP